MKFNRGIIPLDLFFLLVFFVSGCAPLARFVVGKNTVEIPQIVANLEPSLRDNRIAVSGKILIQNPTKSSLDLDKIYLEILGENKVVLEKMVLDWESGSVTSGHDLEAPVNINLSLSALNNKSISVFIRTGFTYKALGLHIPVDSRVAVLHLEALKETIARPLYVNIFTKVRSRIFGDSSVDFSLGISNPLSIDLALEEGVISINTFEGNEIARSAIPRTLFRGSQSSQIRGSINIGNVWTKLIRNESILSYPLKFELSGKMRIPETDIFIPFKIESSMEIKFVSSHPTFKFLNQRKGASDAGKTAK
ncbi:MAG: hypothetical protein PHN57_02655 [Candidatus Omnitrophica bacterium]|nr:hypothetical protein [Candidatus Omnitrophota bacterium]